MYAKETLRKLLQPPRKKAGLKIAVIILTALAINALTISLCLKRLPPSAEKAMPGALALDGTQPSGPTETCAGTNQPAEIFSGTNESSASMTGAIIIEKRIPVDLAGITDIKEKVSKIFNAFLENARNRKMASFPSLYADQMAELGSEAVPELLKMLEECMREDESSEDGMDQEKFNKQMFLAEALGKMLTEQDKAVILQYFDKHGMFGALIAKYRFPEADEMIFNKLAEGSIHNAIFVNYKDERDLIDAALAVDEERTVESLLEQLRQGNISESALERMAHIPDLDPREPLREAAANNKSDYDRLTILKSMLELGMAEGPDLALALLKSDQEWARNKVRDLLPNYTGVIGSADEMAAWLETHRGELSWNPKSRRYELKTGP